MDGDSCRDDDDLDIIAEDWPQISQRFDTNNNFLVMKISADRFQKDLVLQLQDIIGQHDIKAIDQQLYCDQKQENWFLVFRLNHHLNAISFESLYFNLPAGVDFHFFRRSPIDHPAS